jgi:superfamily I DNA/RNA helicase
MTNRDWSAQQGQIFAWTKGDFAAIEASLARKLTADERRNLVVRARAGTGKTTTIVEAIRYAREGRILLAAFNKKIATELTERLSNPAAEAKTLHSVGYSAIRRYCDVRIDNVKGRREEELAIAAAGDAPPEILKLIGSLCSKAREIIPLRDRIGRRRPRLRVRSRSL